MTTSGDVASGKGYRDENFPVASWLVSRHHREPILAFYRFVRAADDVADHPSLSDREKLTLIDRLEQTLLGCADADPAAFPLRGQLAARQLSPRHAQDLLTAFRLDVNKRRYRDWDDLLGYCRYSAMPVGRFVLEVHAENPATWATSDALCAALQVINHLQDCAADYRTLDRVYIPMDVLDRHHTAVEALGAHKASPGLRRSLSELGEHVGVLLRRAEPLSSQVGNMRLALEIAVIHQIAVRLTDLLRQRDPLCDPVHLSKLAFAVTGAFGMLSGFSGRLRRRGVRADRVAPNA